MLCVCVSVCVTEDKTHVHMLFFYYNYYYLLEVLHVCMYVHMCVISTHQPRVTPNTGVRVRLFVHPATASAHACGRVTLNPGFSCQTQVNTVITDAGENQPCF